VVWQQVGAMLVEVVVTSGMATRTSPLINLNLEIDPLLTMEDICIISVLIFQW